MNNPVYLALYKNKRNWRKEPLKALADGITRFFTKGQYSHCELVVERTVFTGGKHYEREVYYDCYSSSVQDGGVRCKQIDVSDSTKWDLISLDGISEAQIRYYYELTKGRQYDWWGQSALCWGLSKNAVNTSAQNGVLTQLKTVIKDGGLARMI
ncbi:Uncharacterised protein [Rodentibacter pneumotropicus]|uniref:Enoyl-CoA hydratase n=1 Tax=Rodentibacter pneumotropicus TaxID=758 RepID=A0A3S4TY07_9PAST|nr:Uncharacterised protein [Rodentibacter pneumotropicus]